MKAHQTSWYTDTAKAGIFTFVKASATTAALFKYSTLPPIFSRNLLSISGLKNQYSIINTGWRLKDALRAGTCMGVAATIDALVLHALYGIFTTNNNYFNSGKKQPPAWLHLAARISAIGITALVIGPNPIFLANAAIDVSSLVCDYLVNPEDFSQTLSVKPFGAYNPILLKASSYILPAALGAIAYLGFESFIYSKLNQLKKPDDAELPKIFDVNEEEFAKLFEISDDKLPEHVKDVQFLDLSMDQADIQEHFEFLRCCKELYQFKANSQTDLFNELISALLNSADENKRFFAEILLNPVFEEEDFNSIIQEFREYEAAAFCIDYKAQCDRIIEINETIQNINPDEEDWPELLAKDNETAVKEFLNALDNSDLGKFKESSASLSKTAKMFSDNYSLKSLEDYRKTFKVKLSIDHLQLPSENESKAKEAWDEIIRIDHEISQASSLEVIAPLFSTENNPNKKLEHPWVKAYLSSLDMSSLEALKTSSNENSDWAKKFSDQFSFEDLQSTKATRKNCVVYESVSNIHNNVHTLKKFEKNLASICFTCCEIFSAVFPNQIESFEWGPVALAILPKAMSLFSNESPTAELAVSYNNTRLQWEEVLDFIKEIEKSTNDSYERVISTKRDSDNPFIQAFIGRVDSSDFDKLQQSSKQFENSVKSNLDDMANPQDKLELEKSIYRMQTLSVMLETPYSWLNPYYWKA